MIYSLLNLPELGMTVARRWACLEHPWPLHWTGKTLQKMPSRCYASFKIELVEDFGGRSLQIHQQQY
jgi:hypothetical protein